jgi:hypothetical protein
MANSAPEIEVRQPLSGQNNTLYFDALSDNGRDAVIIMIAPPEDLPRPEPVGLKAESCHLTIAFLHNADRVFNADCIAKLLPEGSPDDARTCVLELAAASYGVGYLIKCRVPVDGGEMLVELEWLFVERPENSNTMPQISSLREIIAARADVSGRISVTGRRFGGEKIFHFRGTGYHDRRLTPNSLKSTSHTGIWARAHFSNCTVFIESPKAVFPAKDSIFSVLENGCSLVTATEAEIKVKFSALSYPRRFFINAATGRSDSLTLETSKTILQSVNSRFCLSKCFYRKPANEALNGVAICEIARAKPAFPLIGYALNKFRA